MKRSSLLRHLRKHGCYLKREGREHFEQTCAIESAMIVKLKKPNTRYRDLTSGQLYDVIGIESDELRILNNASRLSYIPLICFH